jgi:hypothetical protein
MIERQLRQSKEDNNGQPLRKFQIRQCHAMRSVRRQVWSRQVLLVAHPVLLQELRQSLSIPSEERPQLDRLDPIRIQSAARDPCEGIMTLHISRRGKEYLETAQTLLRCAKTMADGAIAGRLKAFAEDHERRAGNSSVVDAAKGLARSSARSAVAHTHL